jgi:hypothetical protein
MEKLSQLFLVLFLGLPSSFFASQVFTAQFYKENDSISKIELFWWKENSIQVEKRIKSSFKGLIELSLKREKGKNDIIGHVELSFPQIIGFKWKSITATDFYPIMEELHFLWWFRKHSYEYLFKNKVELKYKYEKLGSLIKGFINKKFEGTDVIISFDEPLAVPVEKEKNKPGSDFFPSEEPLEGKIVPKEAIESVITGSPGTSRWQRWWQWMRSSVRYQNFMKLIPLRELLRKQRKQ